MAGEDELIGRILRQLGHRPGKRMTPPGTRLVLGVGDDAAILRPASRFDWVVSTDFSLEDVHFHKITHPPEAVGYRALARAASDLAAMGAWPEFFLLSLALPPARAGRWLDRMLAGMSQAARRLGLRLVGGDTTRQPKVAIAITVLGRTRPGCAVRRDGARPGDRLYLSGKLGAAALGLELMLRNRTSRSPLRRNSRFPSFLNAHLYPNIPLGLGILLAENHLASAMIDLSDGLSTDLARLARASHVGARLWVDRLPMVPVPMSLERQGIDPLKLALNGGEDYGLLFAVRPGRAARVPRQFGRTRITCIGEITRSPQILLVDASGRKHALPAGGWDPFRQRRRTSLLP
jgi:thiamine-monophosphate kinase